MNKWWKSCAPITNISPKRFNRAKKFLLNHNVDLTAGKLTGRKDYYRSASIAERADEINELIHNDNVDIIMSTIGGLNTNSVLPYIDYEFLQNHPKTFIGYSDTTALLLAVQSHSPNCRVLYGPALVASFGEFSPIVDQTWDYFDSIISSNGSKVVRIKAPTHWTDEKLNWESFEKDKALKENKWGYIQNPIMEGRLIGGNLDTISGILASPYFPSIEEGDILFIEDAEKDASIVEKNFAMIEDAGIFSQISGLLLGKHALFDDLGTNRKPIDILKEALGNTKIPIVYDYDSCHTVPMITTPLGSHVKINALERTIEFSDF